MATKYNAEHLSSMNKYQLQMTNWYEVVIGDLGEELTLMVQSCTLPEIANSPIEVGYGNSTAKLPGKVTYADSSVTFMDAIKADTEKKILAWQKKVYDAKTGKMSWVETFKKNMSITQYGPDGTCLRKWELKGCWPSSINYGEMNSEQADKKNISVTISYDSADRV